MSDSGLGLTHESTYPYKAAVASCPSVDTYNQAWRIYWATVNICECGGVLQGAVVTGNQYTYQGTEELLEQMVAEHGAAVSSLATDGNFMDYAGGSHHD